MPTYSHSRLATYENCPRQYKLLYIDKIELPEESEGIEAFMGSRVHEVLEKLHKELILSKLNTLDDLHKYYSDLWAKNWHDNVVVVKKGFTADHYRTAGEKAIADYYQRYHPFTQSKTIATEQIISFRIGDYTLRGFIDRLSRNRKGIYEIHDYKTSASLPTQDRIDNDRQLALYHIGIREKYRDARDVRLIWHYLLFDKELVSQRTEAQLKDLKKEVLSLIKTIEKDTEFIPVESKLCDWCEFPEYCPAKKHEIAVEGLPPNKYLKDKGVKLVNKFAAIKAKMADLKEKADELQEELDLIAEAAVEYARREGITSITGSEHILKVLEQKALQFPRAGDKGRKELEDYLRRSIIWPDISGLNISRLEALYGEGDLKPGMMKKLAAFLSEETKIRVKLLKKRAEDE